MVRRWGAFSFCRRYPFSLRFIMVSRRFDRVISAYRRITKQIEGRGKRAMISLLQEYKGSRIARREDFFR
jgi:hypothetical protein